LGGVALWGLAPKKRYKHIHVRLGSAIHGSAHFWEQAPTAPPPAKEK